MIKTESYLLVVEDDKDLLDAYQRILSTVTSNVKVAQDGAEALSIIETQGDPAIIFLDLRMPGMDGIEFLKNYDVEAHPETEIILFSNYDTKAEVDEAFELGARRYILKARMTPNELIRITKATLSHQS